MNQPIWTKFAPKDHGFVRQTGSQYSIVYVLFLFFTHALSQHTCISFFIYHLSFTADVVLPVYCTHSRTTMCFSICICIRNCACEKEEEVDCGTHAMNKSTKTKMCTWYFLRYTSILSCRAFVAIYKCVYATSHSTQHLFLLNHILCKLIGLHKEKRTFHSRFM